jgi:hypothetical protein
MGMARRTRSWSTVTAADLGLPERPPCPFCSSDDTELHAPFGSQLSVVTYWCHGCRTAFEWFKWDPR